MRATTRLIAVAAMVLASSSGVARAQQPSAADRETARSLMDDGDKKRDAGDLPGALKSYVAADAIMNVTTTGIEVARTQIALGLLIEAKETLGRVVRIPPKPREPAPFTAARRSAEELAAEVAGRIPSLLVTAKKAGAGKTPQITIDGEPIPPAAAALPRKVNPGRHTIALRLGAALRNEEVTVAEREDKIVELDAEEPPPARPAEPPAEHRHDVDATPSILMYGGFACAALGLAVGAVTGISSLSKTSDLKASCPNDACTPDRQADIDSARALGNVSTAAFVAAGIGAGAGVIGLVLRSSRSARAPASAARAVVGPTYVGVAAEF